MEWSCRCKTWRRCQSYSRCETKVARRLFRLDDLPGQNRKETGLKVDSTGLKVDSTGLKVDSEMFLKKDSHWGWGILDRFFMHENYEISTNISES